MCVFRSSKPKPVVKSAPKSAMAKAVVKPTTPTPKTSTPKVGGGSKEVASALLKQNLSPNPSYQRNQPVAPPKSQAIDAAKGQKAVKVATPTSKVEAPKPASRPTVTQKPTPTPTPKAKAEEPKPKKKKRFVKSGGFIGSPSRSSLRIGGSGSGNLRY